MTDTNSGHRLRFVSSAAVLLHVHGKPQRVSVPALPWWGFWAVTQVSEYSLTITHVISGIKIGDVSSIRAGRMVCAVLNALPFDRSDLIGQCGRKAGLKGPWKLERFIDISSEEWMAFARAVIQGRFYDR